MFFKKNLVLAYLCLTALVGGLEAQTRSVFVLPTSSNGVQVYSSDSFGSSGSFGSAPAPFLVLANGPATKYYVISKSPTNTVIVVDGNNFSTLVKDRFNFGANAEAAAITPDGKRLIVAAGNIHIIDTATDTDLTPAGIGLNLVPNDVVVSQDSTRAFVLSRGGLVVSSFDLTTNTPTSLSFQIPNVDSTVSIAPNGLLYVTARNRMFEVDPKTLKSRFEISLTATPGKPVFTSDGKYAVFINQTPLTGSSIVVIDLTTHQFAKSLPNSLSFDQLLPAGPSSMYATSVSSGKVYAINIPDLSGNEANFGNGSITGVLAATTSNEVQPRALYIAASNALYRVDVSPGSNLVTQQTGLSSQTQSLNFAGPAITGSPSQLLLYNNNQTAAVGAALTPLVVRVADSAGRPLANAAVTFSASDAGTQILSPNTVTNNDGYAQTAVTASATTGAYNVSVSAGSAVGTYSLTVTASGTGGTGGTDGTGGTGNSIISITSGNGQLIQEQFQANDLLGVLIKDAQGKPVPGATVNFAITSGLGALQATSGLIGSLGVCTPNDQTAVCSTDANGMAGVGFRSNSTNGQSYATTTVAASYGGASVNFVETTFLGLTPSGFAGPTITDIAPTLGSDRTFTLQAGQTLTGALKVQIAAGAGPVVGSGIPNVAINATTGLDPATGPTASCNGATQLSDASGIATCDLVAGGKVGTAPLRVSVGSSNDRGFATLIVTPGPAGLLNILQGNNQSGIAGQRLPLALVAQVTDAFGNVLPGQQVTFEVVNQGSVTLSNVFNTSDVNGKVSALATLGGTPGPQQVRVKVGNATSTFTLTTNVTFGGITVVSGNGQSAVVKQAFSQPLVVKVTDNNGAVIPNATVAFTVNGGTATLSAASATTDASGNASVTATAGANAGSITVNATVGNFTAAFNLTSRLPGPSLSLAGFKNGASFAPGISPGAILSIQGPGIAPAVQGVVTSSIVGELPLALAGVDVTFNGIQAPIYSVSNVNGTEQVNVQVPFELPPGQANVTVRVNGGSSTINNVPILALSPGIFETADSSGRKYAVVTKDVDGSYVSTSNPAHRGDVIRVYLTGLGQVTPSTATNRAGISGQHVLASIIVGVNNAGVPLGTADYMPGVVGLYTVTFTVPADAPAGNSIPLSFGVTGADGNRVYSNTSNLAIQ